MTYSLDAASAAGGVILNTTNGNVIYPAGWSGTTTITASARDVMDQNSHPYGNSYTICRSPVFVLGANSTRCQGAGTVTYTANATNNTGITYSLDAASIAGGNTINAATGAVTYLAGWTGTSTITASAAGCNGPEHPIILLPLH